MQRSKFRIIGILFWATGAIIVGIGTLRMENSKSSRGPISVVDFLFSRNRFLSAIDLTGTLQKADPVFIRNNGDQFYQVGQVHARTSDTEIMLMWYDRQFEPSELEFVQYRNDGSLRDVARMMLPQSKRDRIEKQLTEAFKQHGDEFSRELMPLVQQSVERSLPLIEEEFRRSIARHQDEIDRLTDRWNEEVVETRLIPLAKKEIMPIVKRHGQPTAEKIGREVWNRASLWRFGWRAVYDKTPLPERNMVKEEWERFVESEAVPVIEENMDDIVESVQKILAEIAANPLVRSEIAQFAKQIASDPDATKLVKKILHETLVDNPRLHEIWRDVWQGDKAEQAIARVSGRMEPVIREIGDELFGTQQDGIDPMFALVLRNQIFGKDRRWIVAQPKKPALSELSATSGAITIPLASDKMVYPIVYMADQPIETDRGTSP